MRCYAALPYYALFNSAFPNPFHAYYNDKSECDCIFRIVTVQPHVKTHNLRHAYADGTQVDLAGCDLAIWPGDRVGVVGANGAGKSTLFLLLLGMLRPSNGAVEVLGHDPAADYAKIRQRIGVVLQNVEYQILAPTVWEDVSFSPRNYGLPSEETRRLTDAVMETLRISHLKDKVPHYLSAGEKRRVALAGALVMQPDLLVLDEPFEGLDPASRVDLIALLNTLNRERGTTLIISTHHLDLIPSISDGVYVLDGQRGIVCRYCVEDLFEQDEMLREINVSPPILSELFGELRQRGVDAKTPVTVSQAAENLMALIRDGNGKSEDNSTPSP